MDKKRLSFATMFDLGGNIFSIVVDEGVVIGLEHVDEYHHYLLSEGRGKNVGVLVQRLYSYGYTDSAKTILASLPQMQAIAVVTYDEESYEITQLIKNFNQAYGLSFEVFSDDALAESWLRRQMELLA